MRTGSAAGAICMAFTLAAFADPMTKSEYQAARKNIASDYRNARVGCEPMPSEVRAACVADVNGREEVASAELEVAYKPGPKAHYVLRIAKSQAEEVIAKDKCVHKAEAPRRVCLREAEAAGIAARAAAESQFAAARQPPLNGRAGNDSAVRTPAAPPRSTRTTSPPASAGPAP